MKSLLAFKGKLVFAVDTIANICLNDSNYKTVESVKTKEGLILNLKCKNNYEADSQTQYSPSIYELYEGDLLLQKERMDFQTHFYKFNEMEGYLKLLGFASIKAYSTLQKDPAINDKCEIFLYECEI